MSSPKKILVWATNRDRYDDPTEPTGLWLGEYTHFVDEMVEAGWACDLASPAGGVVPLDPRSLRRMFTTAEDRRRLGDAEFLVSLRQSRAATEIDPDEYVAAYYTGGHGTMWDFPENRTMAAVSQRIHQHGGVIAAVCHGVGGLLPLLDEQGGPLIAGHAVTGYSDVEEVLACVHRLVPFSLESALQKRGARFHKALVPFQPYVRTSDRLLTGQNPQSTKKLARAVRSLLCQLRD
jgi:putative intracellular protease/amidase